MSVLECVCGWCVGGVKCVDATLPTADNQRSSHCRTEELFNDAMQRSHVSNAAPVLPRSALGSEQDAPLDGMLGSVLREQVKIPRNVGWWSQGTCEDMCQIGATQTPVAPTGAGHAVVTFKADLAQGIADDSHDSQAANYWWKTRVASSVLLSSTLARERQIAQTSRFVTASFAD